MVISATELTKTYKKHNALENVNLSIDGGKVYGFVGRNGAGKTTFLRILMGLAFPTRGRVGLFDTFEPREVNRNRSRIGCIIESPVLYANKTAHQNMEIMGFVKNAPDYEDVFKKFNLSEYGNKKTRDYSLGMRQRLAIAMATVGHPELLILDEPLNGLDPLSIVEVNSMIKTLSDEGVTILVSSHILSELSRVASDFIFIDAGKIIGQTTLEAIKSRTTDHSELVTNNNEAALELLSARGIRAEQDGGVIRVYNDGNIETDEIAGMLFENKISVTGLTKISENLEDYFLNLINAGGVTR